MSMRITAEENPVIVSICSFSFLAKNTSHNGILNNSVAALSSVNHYQGVFPFSVEL